MKKISLLTVAISVALSGCGNDSSSSKTTSSTPSTPSTSSQNITITAVDGYLSNATVKGGENCTETLGDTDGQGKLAVDNKYENQPICITAVKGKTIDLTRGPVENGFELTAPAGYTTVSPITHLVSEQMKQGVSESEARKNVIESIVALQSDDQPVSEEVIFGDFIQEDSTLSNAVELIAETLVDSEQSSISLTIDEKLSATKLLSDDIAEQIKSNGSLPEDYAPRIIKDDNGVSNTANNKPVVKEGFAVPSEEQTNYFIEGDAVSINPINIADWFKDKDSDQLTYTVQAYLNNNAVTDITINESNEIQGTLKKAGDYIVYVFANDGKNRSNPVEFKIVVKVANEAPTVNSEAVSRIQNELNQLTIRANESITKEISIDSLFSDTDKLTYAVSHQSNGKIKIDGENLSISGTFNSSDVGKKTISISADDGINSPVTREFTISIQEALVINHAPVVEEQQKSAIQSGMDTWVLTEGETIKEIIDLSNLFTDSDNDSITYIVETTLAGISVKVTEAKLSFSGTLTQPADARSESLTIKASDKKDQSNPVIFYFSEIKKTDQEVEKNTLTNFLVNNDLAEYDASMNYKLFERDDNGVSTSDPSYKYDDDKIKISGDKLCIVEDNDNIDVNQCTNYDQFIYVGSNNNLAVASTVTNQKDLILWSHDDLHHNAETKTIPERFKSGVWYSLVDDSETRKPDMLISEFNFDTKTVKEGAKTDAFTVSYENKFIKLAYNGEDEENCKVLSVENDLIAVSCIMTNDPDDKTYTLWSQDKNLIDKLVAATK